MEVQTTSDDPEPQQPVGQPELQNQVELLQLQLAEERSRRAQTERSLKVKEQALNELKAKYTQELEKNKTIRAQAKTARDTMAAELQQRYEKFHRVVDTHVQAGMDQAANKPVHFAPHGSVWHADPMCEALTRPGTTKFTRRPCKVCAHTIAPRVSKGEVADVLARRFQEHSPARASTDWDVYRFFLR